MRQNEKKKNRKLVCMFLLGGLLFSLSGCQLAQDTKDSKEESVIREQEEQVEQKEGTQQKEQAKQDAFVGLLITKEPLEEKEKYYGTEKEEQYTFEGIDAIYYMEINEWEQYGYDKRTIYGSDELCDMDSRSYSGAETEPVIEKSDTLSANIYLNVKEKGDTILYVNPIFRTTEGEVYAMADDSQGELFQNVKTTVTKEYSRTVTKDDNTVQESMKASVTIKGKEEPESYCVVEMDEQGQSISEKTYLAGEMPDVYNTQKETASIMLETYEKKENGKEKVSRVVYEKSQEDRKEMETYELQESGYFTMHITEIKWGKALQ